MNFLQLSVYYDKYAKYFELGVTTGGTVQKMTFPDNNDWRWALHDENVQCKPYLRRFSCVDEEITVPGYNSLSGESEEAPFVPAERIVSLGGSVPDLADADLYIAALKEGDEESPIGITAKWLMSWSIWVGKQSKITSGEILETE